MAKYNKLAIAPDGEVVFRSTGRIVSKDVEIRGNRAYVNGRLYGYIAKGTKTEQAKIAKVAKSPTRKHRAKVKDEATRIRKEGLTLQEPQSPTSIQSNKSVKEWFNRAQLQADALKYIRKNYGDRGNVEVSKDTQSLLNYATVLNKAVKSGKLSPTKARELYSRMLDAKGEARLQLWQETADLFDKLDYKYTIHSRVKNQED